MRDKRSSGRRFSSHSAGRRDHLRLAPISKGALMRYRIRHDLTYTYTQPVPLSPQTLRLRPRCDATQTVQEYCLTLEPVPLRLYENVALDGSTATQVLFSQPLTAWHIQMETVVMTHRQNPFDFLLEPWAVCLPIHYPHALVEELQPYREASGDPLAVRLAQEVWHETEGQVLAFLSQLNQRIYRECTHMIRPTGSAWPAGITWSKKQGACRDLTVLFMTVCRAMGLATRFVSGYHEGDPDWQHRHLHAWAEVYLPGGGWRGYDPTHGLAVNDRYVP